MSLDLSLNYPDFNLAMDNNGKNDIYEFDRFRIDPRKLMLYRDGEEVSLPPKMVKTLTVLVENRGTILSKDELIDGVWSDAIVDESNLSQHLHHLRKILGVQPDGRPYIETLRRRGYRFNGDVHVADPPKQEIRPIAETVPSVMSAGVERNGNVLRLVDWAPSSRNVSDPSTPIERNTRQSPATITASRRTMVVVAAVLLLVMASIAVVFKFRSAAIPHAAAISEISMLRLTNGIAPESAAISPNGDYFAYHEIAEDGERMWLQQIGQASRIKIGETPKGEFYGAKTFSPDGKVLFFILFDQTSKGVLYRMPAIGGPQVKILEDVEYPISFSPDGAEFVLIRFDKVSGTSSLVIAGKDGNSQRTVLQKTGRARLVGSPAWSPDGKSIVFASTDPDNSIAIYVTDPAGSTPKRISQERWDNAYRIAWLPDGRGLVIIATRFREGYTTRRNQIYLISYPEGTSRRLTSDGNRYNEWSLGVSNDEAILAIPGNRSSQIWSLSSNGSSSSAMQLSRGQADGRAGIAVLPDGRVGFNSRVGEEVGIWLMNADGSGLRQLPTGVLPVVEELRADPKGRFFVFSGHKDAVSRLYRFDVDGSKLTQLTFGDDQPVDSTISPEGDGIVYSSVISGGIARSPILLRIPLDGGNPVRVGAAECEMPHYSPEGDRLSCIRGEELVLLSADGAPIRTYRLLPYARVNFGAKWTPDGKGLVYIRIEKGVGNLWVQPIDGGVAKQLTDFAIGELYNFALSSDGTRLFVARGQQIADAILIRNYR